MAGGKGGVVKRRREEVSQVPPLNHHLLLPEDIIVDEILTRLPVKSLLKFRCVCKSWLSLISSSRFIKNHLIKNSKSNYKYKAIIQTTDSSSNNFTYYAYSFESILYDHTSPMNAIEQIDIPTIIPTYRFDSLPIGSCNGMLCVSPSPDTYTIFNPSVRKFHKLPFLGTPDRYTLGFGYDEVNNDYKVVKVFGLCGPRNDAENDTEAKIYSLKNRCWRSIKNQQIGPFLSPVGGVLVSGKLHWATYGRTNVFVSLDMATEEFGKVARPKNGYGESVVWYLVESRGRLYSFADNMNSFMDVWEMKEYGVEEESWTKLGTIPYFNGGVCKQFLPFFVTEDGVVILQSSVCMVLYNLKYSKFVGHKFYNNGHDGINREALFQLPPYIETFVPPCFDR